MSDKHLRRTPTYTRHTLDHRQRNLHMWYYDDPGGIWITVSPVFGTRTGIIPWRQIKAALKRKEQL